LGVFGAWGAEPGCALRRARYRRAQRSRAHGGPPGHRLGRDDGAGGPPRSRPSGRASLTQLASHQASASTRPSVRGPIFN